MIAVPEARGCQLEVSVVGDDDLRTYRDGGNPDPLWREAMEAFLADHPEAALRLKSLGRTPGDLN